MDRPLGRPDAPLMTLNEVLSQYVTPTISDAVEGVTGWTPGTTPSWMPQWVTDLSEANKAADAAQRQRAYATGAKFGLTPEQVDRTQELAMGFAGPIEAWHGTGANFAKFDAAAIGTGEGSALYGRAPGGYHAEARATGEAYDQGQVMKTLIDAEPEEFLHWNEPLSEMHPDVRAQVQKVIPTSGKDLMRARKVYKNADPDFREIFRPDLDTMSDIAAGTATGEDIYQYLMRQSGEADEFARKDFATQQLHEAGLPGIRYYDDFLHYPGEEGAKSHSYAVFNPELVEILERLGGPSWGKTATGGAR